MPLATITWNVRDHSDEYSNFSINIEYDSDDEVGSLSTRATALRVLVAAMVTGNIATQSITVGKVSVQDARPANPYAQRELGLRLFYQDTVTAKKYHITVPTPDLVIVGSGGTDDVDLSGVAVVNALVTALQTSMRSPDGNTVQVYRGSIVGRRN